MGKRINEARRKMPSEESIERRFTRSEEVRLAFSELIE